MKKRIWAVVATALGLLAGATASAAYPDKPIQLIVPYGAGGSTDLLARAVATVAPKYFPQPVVVVNKGGGGGIPGRVEVVRAKPDGYTLLFGWGSGEDLVDVLDATGHLIVRGAADDDTVNVRGAKASGTVDVRGDTTGLSYHAIAKARLFSANAFSAQNSLTLDIKNPKLWSPDSPFFKYFNDPSGLAPKP